MPASARASAQTAPALWRSVRRETPDLALLDVMLPDMSGFDICREIRKTHFFPIIMLTAKIEDNDKILGLTLGADDYITKPFNPLEVVARVRTQLRRASTYNYAAAPESVDEIDIRGLVINRAAHSCSLYGEQIALTPLEFEILWYLASNQGRVVPSEELFEAVWQEKYFKSNNTVMSHIAVCATNSTSRRNSQNSSKPSGGLAMRSNNNISRWTGVLFRRYLRQCTLWAAALIVCGGLFDIIIQIMPMYYQAEFYLRYRSLYTACVCVAIWTVIVLVLTWRLVRRAASYIDEVQEAAHQVASANDDLITLSPELSEIAADLNQLKQESLANARAAKEAENPQERSHHVPGPRSQNAAGLCHRLSAALAATSPPFQKKRARATWPQPCAKPSGSMR